MEIFYWQNSNRSIDYVNNAKLSSQQCITERKTTAVHHMIEYDSLNGPTSINSPEIMDFKGKSTDWFNTGIWKTQGRFVILAFSKMHRDGKQVIFPWVKQNSWAENAWRKTAYSEHSLLTYSNITASNMRQKIQERIKYYIKRVILNNTSFNHFPSLEYLL